LHRRDDGACGEQVSWMAAVRCPICDKRLVAADGDILSGALTMHFHRDHGLVLPDPELITGGREGHVSSLAELSDIEEGETRGGSPAYGGAMTQRGGALYGVTGPPRSIAGRGSKGHYVDCPMCGMEVQGENEGALSLNLREHMAKLHELPAERP